MTSSERTCLTCGSRLGEIGDISESPLLTPVDTNPEADKHWNYNTLECSELTQVDTELRVLRAQALARDLQWKQKMSKKYCRQHHWLMSPIERIPNELLSEIFVHAIHSISSMALDPGCSERHDAMKCRRSILLPAQVCKRWRDVSISRGRSWSFIYVPTSRRTIAFTSEMTRLWLLRSDGCPLHVMLGPRLASDLLTFNDSSPSSEGYIYKQIATHSDRWKSLVAKGLSFAQLSYLSDAQSRLPTLESLSISVLDIPVPINIFEFAPKLRHVIFHGSPHHSRIKFRLPWNQLSSLTLTFIEVSDMLNILRQCLNLEQCALKVRSPVWSVATTHHVILSTRSKSLPAAVWNRNSSNNYYFLFLVLWNIAITRLHGAH